MGLIDSIKENAKKELKTIVLPEPEDERVLKATQQVLAEKTAKVVLIGNPQTIQLMQQNAEQTLRVQRLLTLQIMPI